MFSLDSKQKSKPKHFVASQLNPKETTTNTYPENLLNRSSEALLGNQFMQRSLQNCALSLPEMSNYLFGGVCHTYPTIVQTKLTIGQPGDKYEKEADRVADEVMRMPEQGVDEKAALNNTPTISKIQKQYPECEEDIQRQVEEEEEEEEILQTKEVPGQSATLVSNLEEKIDSLNGGVPLPENVRNYFEPRFGYDFDQVRIHTGSHAACINQDLKARAFTIGKNIIFNSGEFSPHSFSGMKLLAHELVHTIQQKSVSSRGSNWKPSKFNINLYTNNQIQRRVRFDVLDWDAYRLGPPIPQNGSDPRTILIPPTGQIQISGLVQVNGDSIDPCAGYELGTTQTAWIAWTIMNYRGRTSADGSVLVRHRVRMPMRDPAPTGNIWYDTNNVRNPGFCGDSVGIFHVDSPWHNPPKARNNSRVAGNPLNYLYRYRRGLHLVTYLTARDNRRNFLRRPLRFIYWNSIQDFHFTPQYPTSGSALTFFAMWPFSGQISVNIGAKGRGVTTDAPYYTTSGADFNTHFNTSANWQIREST